MLLHLYPFFFKYLYPSLHSSKIIIQLLSQSIMINSTSSWTAWYNEDNTSEEVINDTCLILLQNLFHMLI